MEYQWQMDPRNLLILYPEGIENPDREIESGFLDGQALTTQSTMRYR
jgi:hypothetical protein